MQFGENKPLSIKSLHDYVNNYFKYFCASNLPFTLVFVTPNTYSEHMVFLQHFVVCKLSLEAQTYQKRFLQDTRSNSWLNALEIPLFILACTSSAL